MKPLIYFIAAFFLTANISLAQEDEAHSVYNYNYLEAVLTLPNSPVNLSEYSGVFIVLAHIPNDAAENNTENLLSEYFAAAFFKGDGVTGVNAGKVSLNDKVLQTAKVGSWDYYYYTNQIRKDLHFRDTKIDWDIEGMNNISEFSGDSLSRYLKFPFYYYFSAYNHHLQSETIQDADLTSILSLNTKNPASNYINSVKPDFVVTFLTSLTKELAHITNHVQIYKDEMPIQIENAYPNMGYFFNSKASTPAYPKGKYMFIARSYKLNEVNVPVAKESSFTTKWLFITCVETQVDWLLR